jgi:hypothetical protein
VFRTSTIRRRFAIIKIPREPIPYRNNYSSSSSSSSSSIRTNTFANTTPQGHNKTTPPQKPQRITIATMATHCDAKNSIHSLDEATTDEDTWCLGSLTSSDDDDDDDDDYDDDLSFYDDDNDNDNDDDDENDDENDDDDDLSFYEDTQDILNDSDRIRFPIKTMEHDPLSISDSVRSIQLADIDPLNASESVRSMQEISLDLGDLLDEIEESEELRLQPQQSGVHNNKRNHIIINNHINNNNNHSMGSSKLCLASSSTESLDWGSVNWKDLFGSSKLLRKTSVESHRRSPKKSPKMKISRKKTVRFQKFETVFHY